MVLMIYNNQTENLLSSSKFEKNQKTKKQLKRGLKFFFFHPKFSEMEYIYSSPL